jgi:hypothetical protein
MWLSWFLLQCILTVRWVAGIPTHGLPQSLHDPCLTKSQLRTWLQMPNNFQCSRQGKDVRLHTAITFLTGYLLGLHYNTEDGGSTLLWNIVIYWATWCHIPEDCTLHSHHYQNLKSNISSSFCSFLLSLVTYFLYHLKIVLSILFPE